VRFAGLVTQPMQKNDLKNQTPAAGAGKGTPEMGNDKRQGPEESSMAVLLCLARPARKRNT
jgi:hypothetical protein